MNQLSKQNESMIAYCGLYCGDCFNFKGRIADLARDLRKELREAKFDRASKGLSKYFKQFSNYPQCYEVLGAMVRLRCKRTCRGGGGPPACKIRTCSSKKNLQGCWQCETFEKCEKLDFLKPIHGDEHIKNLSSIKKHGVQGFLERKWQSQKSRARLKLGVLFKEKCGFGEDAPNRHFLRANLFAPSTSCTSLSLAFRGNMLPVLAFDFIRPVLHVVFVVKRNYLRYVNPFRAWHAIPAACALGEA